MNVTLTILRFLHIVPGIFWVGATMLFTFFIEPVVSAMGPDGGKFMQRLTGGTKYIAVMGAASTLTLLSGFALYGYFIANAPGWAGSAQGIVFGLGGVLALGAYVIGLVTMRPTSQRISRLGQEIVLAGGPPSPVQAADMAALQGKMRKGGRIVVAHQIAAAVCMAVARYIW